MPKRMREAKVIQIGELKSSVYNINDQIHFLSGGHKVLSEASTTADKKLETVDTRLDSMESTLQSMVRSMDKLTSAIHGKPPMYQDHAGTSQNPDNVNSSNLGANPEDI